MNSKAVNAAALGAPAKKKKGLLAKLGKLPPYDIRPLVYPELEGGNPFEPGTKNYHKSVEMRRRLQEMTRTGHCVFVISDYDPFHPDHYDGANYFRAAVPDKVVPDPGSEEPEVASPPSKDGRIANESKLGNPIPKIARRRKNQKIASHSSPDGPIWIQCSAPS